MQFHKIEPLSCYAFSVDLPGQADPENPVGYPLLFTLVGGEILPEDDRGVKIVAFLEDIDGTMVPNGRIEVTDISEAVMFPFHEDAQKLTMLIMNCHLDDRNVQVVIRTVPYIEMLSPNPPPGHIDGPHTWVYTYDPNPRFTAYMENENYEYVEIAEFTEKNFSLDFHDEATSLKTWWQVDIYVDYDVWVEPNIGDPYRTSYRVFRLEIYVDKSLPNWQNP